MLVIMSLYGAVCCLIAAAMLVATAFIYGWRNSQGTKVFPKQ